MIFQLRHEATSRQKVLSSSVCACTPESVQILYLSHGEKDLILDSINLDSKELQIAKDRKMTCF